MAISVIQNVSKYKVVENAEQPRQKTKARFKKID